MISITSPRLSGTSLFTTTQTFTRRPANKVGNVKILSSTGHVAFYTTRKDSPAVKQIGIMSWDQRRKRQSSGDCHFCLMLMSPFEWCRRPHAPVIAYPHSHFVSPTSRGCLSCLVWS
jgi:hypothetical protein